MCKSFEIKNGTVKTFRIKLLQMASDTVDFPSNISTVYVDGFSDQLHNSDIRCNFRSGQIINQFLLVER